MFRASIFCVLLSIVLSSCDSTSSELDSPPPLLPLRLGNQWVMERTDSIGTGHSFSKIDTFTVSYDSLVDGEIWYAITGPPLWNITANMGGSSWYTLREDGLWNRKSTKLSFSEAFHVIRYPSMTGEELSARTGLSTSLVNENAMYDSDGMGPIPTLEFEMHFTQAYNPDGEDSGFSLERSTYHLDGEANAVQHFSPELGLVHLSGIWLRVDDENEQFRRYGTFSFDLIEFIPAPTDE